MELLISLFFLLVFITFVGHGIWTFVAFLVRGFSGGQPAQRTDIYAKLEDLLREDLIDVETHRKVVRAFAIRHSKSPARPIPTSPVADADRRPDDAWTTPPEQTTVWETGDPNRAGIQSPLSDSDITTSTSAPFGTFLPDSPSADEPLVAEIIAEGVEPPTSAPGPGVTSEDISSTEPISVRAERYAAAKKAQTESSVEASIAASAHHETPPLAPQRTWTEWLAAFLEESNIRWGELVGGLLIVSCSTALVISFWSEISAQPLLKFGVFNGVIAALFLLGIHAAKKWNLPSTSQGVLLIAMLLVPLNFIAIAAFTKGAQPDAVTVIGELFTMAIFTGLGYVAAQILTPRWPTGTLFGVVGLSALQLLVRRWCGPDASIGVLRAMVGVVATLYFASHLPATIKLRGSNMLAEPPRDDDSSAPNDQLGLLAAECWKLMGMVFFAGLLCMSFLLLHSEQAGVVLQNVSLFGGLLAAPGLLIASSLLIRARESKDGITAVASTSVGVGSAVLLGAAVLFAWPQPGFLLVASGVAFAACTWVSLESRFSLGHYVASAFLALMVLLSGQVLIGSLPLHVENPSETLLALLSHNNGQWMIGAFGIAAALSYGYRKIGWKEDSAVFTKIAIAFAAIAFCIAFIFGFGRAGDAPGLIGIAGAFGISSLALSAKHRNGLLVWSGATMLLVASMQWLTFGFPFFDDWFDRVAMSVLMLVSVMSILRIGFRWSGRSVPEIAFEWRSITYAGTVVAAFMLVFRLGLSVNAASPLLFAWLSAACLATALTERSRSLFDGFQFAALAACVLALHQSQVHHDIIGARLIDWLEPTSYYWQTILLSSFGVLSLGIKLAFQRIILPAIETESEDALSIRSLPTGLVASIVIGTAILLTVAGSVYMVAPGVGQELSLVRDTSVGRIVPDVSRFHITGISHSAKTILPWAAWLSVLVGSVVAFKAEPDSKTLSNQIRIQLGALIAFSPFLMAAAFFESGVAVASALRWTMAIYFLIGTGVVSLRRFADADDFPTDSLFAFRTLLLLSTVPVFGMLANVIAQTGRLHSPTASESTWLSVTLLVTAVALILAIATRKGSASNATPTQHRFLATTAGMGLIFFVAVAVSMISRTLVEHPVVGPESSSLFRRMGLAGSYVTPMVLFAIGFIGTAYRLRSQGLAFSASILCNVCGTAALLFVRKGSLDECQWMQLAEINAIIAATCVIVWTRWRDGWREGDTIPSTNSVDESAVDESGSRDLIRIVFGIACSFLGLVAVSIVAFVHFYVSPDLNDNFVPVLGLVAMTFVALADIQLRGKRLAKPDRFGPISRFLLMAMCLSLLAAFQSSTTFVAYKLLLVGWPLLPLVSLIFERRSGSNVSTTSKVWPALCFGSIILGCLFALRAADVRSLSDWWTIGGFAAATVVSSVLGPATHKMRFVYMAAILCSITGNAWWILETSNHSLHAFFRINLIAWSLPSIWWSIALWRLPQYLNQRKQLQTYIRFVVVSACLAIAFLSAATFVGGLSSGPWNSSPMIAWTSCICVLLSVLASAFGGCGLR
ncbi:hypothetical protein ACFL2H_04940, partial [Planctomycetota bacterium]